MQCYDFSLGQCQAPQAMQCAQVQELNAAYAERLYIIMHAGHDQPVEDADERLLDMVMLRLRLSDGLDFRVVAEHFGEERASSIRSALRRHVDRGLVEERGSCVRLADPEGFLVSNGIISDAFAALD